MKTPIITKENVEVDLSHEIMSFGLKFGAVVGALSAIIALSCFVSALIGAGPVAMVQGYIAAILGF
jgi:hypothetical protein